MTIKPFLNESNREKLISIKAGSVVMSANLSIPAYARGVVLFAHGSGSSRHSPRNRYVAEVLRQAKLATLLLDLLTVEEDTIDRYTRKLRFEIELLAQRLVYATDWLLQNPSTRDLRIGYFGASTGSAAALVAGTERSPHIGAIVSRGGRVDLAGAALMLVRAPTLLIVGGEDIPVLRMNQAALAQFSTETQLKAIAGATHLFEEPGALEEVARLASKWFEHYLIPIHQQT
jgi:putative phosphoribosyl transferase